MASLFKMLTLCVSVMIFCPLSGQVVERVHMQDGSVYEGFISEQIPGREITVMTENGPVRCKWKDIKRTEKILPENGKTGIRERIGLASGETVTGHIAVQNIGKDIIVKTGNRTRTIPVSDIVEIKSEAVSRDLPLWEQAPLLDRLVMKDGSVIEGFIVSRKMGESVSIMQKNRFKSTTCTLAEIVKYQKVENSEFKAVDRGYSISVNGKDAVLADVEAAYDIVRVDISGLVQIPLEEDSFTVEVSDFDVDANVKLFRLKYDDRNGDAGTEAYSFSMSDKPSAESAAGNRSDGGCSITVHVRKQGIYFLCLKGFEKGIVVECYK